MPPGEALEPASFAGKREARVWARALLRSLEPGERAARSLAAAGRVESLEAFRKSDLLLTFLSLPAEIDTDPVIRAALRAGKDVAAPRMEGGDIAFVPVGGSWASLPRDAMGIPVPEGDPVSIGGLRGRGVFALVPGLLFDRSGGRLGRGKGYYDRFLTSVLSALAGVAASSGGEIGFFVPCGFCYEAQIVGRVPSGEGDVRVPLIATDTDVHTA